MPWVVRVLLALVVVVAYVAYRAVIQQPRSFLSYVTALSRVDPDAAKIALPPTFVRVYGDSLRHQRNIDGGRPLAIVEDPVRHGAKLSLAFFGIEPRLFVHDGKLAAYLLGKQMTNCVGLDPFRKARFSVMYPQSLITASGSDWKRYLSLFQPMFDAALLPEYSVIIVELARDEADRRAGPPVDFADLFKILAARVIGACAFGNSFADPQAAERVARANTAMFAETAKYMNTVAAQLPGLRQVPTGQRRRATAAAQQCREIVTELVQDRRCGRSQPGTSVADFAQKAIESVQRGVMTEAEVADNASLLMVAGHETTAYSMAWMAAIVAKDPNIYDECRREVRRVMGDERTVTPSHIKQMHYLQATMIETLRLFPPIAFVERLCKVPFHVSDQVALRSGTSLTVDVFGIHHNERIWSCPYEARPQRHLVNGVFHRPPDSKFLPFSAGARQCPGRRFAQMEIMLVMASLLRNFDIEWDPNPDFEMRLGITISPKNGVKGRLRAV